MTGLGSLVVAVLSCTLVMWATDARAITFGEWAAGQGWLAGYVTPAKVDAIRASIDSLAGIGGYDWMTTPTTELSLFRNRIASIESHAFAGLGGLTRLDLGSNQITSIESGDFMGLGNLTWLDLRGNEITTIDPGDFMGLGNLTASIWAVMRSRLSIRATSPA